MKSSVDTPARGRAGRFALSLAVLLGMGGVASAPVSADDEPPPPVLHHVKYTVGASTPVRAEIYYRDVDPPSFGDYSHNPYVFSPNVEAELGPGKPWVLEANLADPQAWALVVASRVEHDPEPAAPGFVCELRVDDVVVATDAGTKGVLCSLRTW